MKKYFLIGILLHVFIVPFCVRAQDAKGDPFAVVPQQQAPQSAMNDTRSFFKKHRLKALFGMTLLAAGAVLSYHHLRPWWHKYHVRKDLLGYRYIPGVSVGKRSARFYLEQPSFCDLPDEKRFAIGHKIIGERFVMIPAWVINNKSDDNDYYLARGPEVDFTDDLQKLGVNVSDLLEDNYSENLKAGLKKLSRDGLISLLKNLSEKSASLIPGAESKLSQGATMKVKQDATGKHLYKRSHDDDEFIFYVGLPAGYSFMEKFDIESFDQDKVEQVFVVGNAQDNDGNQINVLAFTYSKDAGDDDFLVTKQFGV